ncbi:YbaK/EbsC protein [Peptostreptococcaceae bacterium oral taxon 113 str. W5053]|nr:YbaK/EbsC protein [Peptostreptococcaceae bacterium oral taxon 113 str. W5053]
MQKTNAMRFLDDLDINYDILEYNASDGKIDGISVAEKIGYSLDMVYKTLVLKGENIFVCIVPVQEEIDLKAMAKAIKEKKVEMIHVKDILTLTGYVRGGCSPFAMKKKYPTYIQEDIILQDEIIVSGGKIGMQIKLKVEDFLKVSEAQIVDVISK